MRYVLLLALLLVGGCESDVKKLQRLQLEKARAHLTLLGAQQDAAHDTIIRDLETRLILAERDLRRFLEP
jgi:hypothetical protein